MQYYEISAVREEGHQLGVHCQEKKLFKLTLHKVIYIKFYIRMLFYLSNPVLVSILHECIVHVL